MTDDLRALLRTIPVADDRILLELANSLSVAEDLTRYRREQTVFGRIIDSLTGKDRANELLTTQHLVRSGQALVSWVTATTKGSAVTNLAVTRVARHLKATQHRLVAAEQLGLRTAAELDGLGQLVAEIQRECDARLTELEQWRIETTLRITAREVFESAVGRWHAERSYTGLPWAFQVVLLAREIATGPCGDWAQVSGDDSYQERLVNSILVDPRTKQTPQSFVLPILVEDSTKMLSSTDERLMVAELMDVGLDPSLALPSRPLIAIIATTLELSTLPESARPQRPAETALALTRRRHGWVDGTADVTSFVQQVVAEQAYAARSSRDAMRTDDGM
jgi:hypothetical protein